MLGRRLGNYVVKKKLGEGGMGAVYLLAHTVLPNKLKALKVLKPGFGEEMQRRFQQEAAAAAAVDTDKVVAIDDVGEFEDGILYIVMEYVEGRSLFDDLKAKGPLPVAVALKLAYRLADTLALFHAKGIVHRDFKPQNIILVKDGYKPKICDFGVAQATGEAALVRTEERIIVGTPGYMSPESVTGLSTDSRTDIYSLGVVTFEMLAGQLPHPAIYNLSINALYDFIRFPSPSIASLRPPSLERVPALAEEVIARAIAKDVENRYTTMVEFRDALGQCLEAMAGDGGVVRNPIYTMLTAAADSNALAPTLRTPAGKVNEMLHNLDELNRPPSSLSPMIAPKADAAHTMRALPAPPLSVPSSSRAPIAVIAIVAVCLAVAAAILLYRQAPAEAPSSAATVPPAAPMIDKQPVGPVPEKPTRANPPTKRPTRTKSHRPTADERPADPFN